MVKKFLSKTNLRQIENIAFKKKALEIERFKKDNETIPKLIKKLNSTKVYAPLNDLQKLYLKLYLLTPLQNNELMELKNSDFVLHDNVCIIKDKYLVFLPLIMECKSVENNNEITFKDLVIRREKFENLKSVAQTTTAWRQRVFKNHDIEPLSKGQYVLQNYFYLLSLGLQDMAQAMCQAKLTRDIYSQLDIKVI